MVLPFNLDLLFNLVNLVHLVNLVNLCNLVNLFQGGGDLVRARSRPRRPGDVPAERLGLGHLARPSRHHICPP